MKQGGTIGKKLSHLSGSFFLKSPINPLDRDDCLLAPRPSDHNAVYAENVTHRAPGKLTYEKNWRLKGLKRGEVGHEAHEPNRSHGLAFLVPVPIYYGNEHSSEVPYEPDGRCATVSTCLR